MKLVKILAILSVLLGSLHSNAAWAGRGHSHHGARVGVGIVIGTPIMQPWGLTPWHYGAAYPYYDPFFYDPFYRYPAPVIVPAAPVVYIEKGNAGTAAADENYWYYCNNPDGYYPYVKQCNSAWQQVSPRPASPR